MADLFSPFPRMSLAHLPTPLEPLPRLSAELGGAELWVKRDDLSGLALGGNKVRKLEFLVGQALAEGADTLVTAGAIQSNHCRQTAAAAARAGLRCVLVLGGEPEASPQGNLLLDALLDAEITWTGAQRHGEQLAAVVAEQKVRGYRPYLVPYGGSNPIGALGFVQAMFELRTQLDELSLVFDRIVFASSSGGTHAGIVVGAKAAGVTGELVGIGIDKEEIGGLPFPERLAGLASQTAGLLGLPWEYAPADFNLENGYLGAGYGVVGALEREALHLTARCEGLLLDPVYTGRAFGAVIDLVRRGIYKPGEKVLFWHTGGAPALFAYARYILS